MLGTSAQEILGEEKVTGVLLKDGQIFDVQMVVVATGCAPTLRWHRRPACRWTGV